jgi:hypothetical protein
VPAPWVAFVNREAEALSALGNLPRGVLRAHLRDRLADAFPHPLRLEVRCLVVGERALESAVVGGQLVVRRAAARFLEAVPEGITREAAALTGPLLVPTLRGLQPGSVVRVKLLLEDPRLRTFEVPGLAGELLSLDAEVPVEP